jgi:fermentation-respiration switch protein FrsA (DUF1100 family)
MRTSVPPNEGVAQSGHQRVRRLRAVRSMKAMTWNSVDKIASFDAFRFVDRISPRPLLVIVGSQAVTSWMARDAFIAAGNPKEVFWIEGASHNDLYDKDQYVSPAVSKLKSFFDASLSA